MAKLNLNRNELDHPEHFDDEIREFRSSERYVPTPLERLLFELAGHRCTICGAPWMEIHHIDEISKGGRTSFENLIVLCPNCHTRVHHENIPNKKELRHYKIKQEIAYELPVISKLTDSERKIIAECAALDHEEQILFSRKSHARKMAATPEEAVQQYRRELGLFHLQESGMISVEESNCIKRVEGDISVVLIVRFTGKGIKWVRYLEATDRVPSS